MRFRFPQAFLIEILFVLPAAMAAWPAVAGTITVDRDGSGDFTTLQPALDACAAGDTVLIGPGEFTQLIPSFIPGYAWDVDVAAYVRVSELTIIGSGPNDTIIGPETFQGDYEKFSPQGIVWLEGGKVYLSGVRVRNCYAGMHVADGMVVVEDCFFEENVIGVSWVDGGVGGGIYNSGFATTQGTPMGLLLLGTLSNATIENCTFDNSALEIQSVQNLTIRGCEMRNGKLGAQISSGSTVLIESCRVFDKTVTGVTLSASGASCTINNSEISGDVNGVSIFGFGTLEANNTIFSGGSRSAIYLDGVNQVTVRYCQILKGIGDFSVWCQQLEAHGGVRHDFRGNYWGTDDGDQIAAWILDGHDDPQIRAEVLYTPFATGDTDLVIALTPNEPEIVIPETGGSFLYDASIENNTGTDIVADLTIEAVLPDGTAFPVMELPGVTLAGASVRTRIGIVQEVPGAAPAGTYTYRVSATLGDTLLVDEAELPFEKLGGGVAAVGAMSWSVTGWLDEDRPPFQGGAVKPVLHGPVPNPFNPTTTVAFELPVQEAVSLHVFDLQGRLVRTLLRDQVCPQGRHEAQWDGRDESGRQAASGTYFFRLEAGTSVETRRAVLIK